MGQAVDPHLNTSAASAIFQGIDPVTLDLGHLHALADSVSYGIRMSSVRAAKGPDHPPRALPMDPDE